MPLFSRNLTPSVLTNAARKRLELVRNTPEKWLYSRGILSTEGLSLPDFLGIGAQKAGTTWLHENLRYHPDLYLPDEKEVHFFDWNFRCKLRYYSSKFERGSGKVKGEITPGYSIIPLRRIKFIRKIMPNVRMIFMMRNPVERAWSQALMNLVWLPKRKFEEVNESEFYAHFQAKRSLKRGDYLSILDNWLRVFPRERFYFGFFEDVADNPQGLLMEVFSHLGVSRDVDLASFPYRQKIYGGPDIPMPRKYREFLHDMYRRDIEELYKVFGDSVASWRC